MSDRTKRMPTRKLRQQCERVAGARVVLHRARAQRVKLRIDRKILLRQARVVPHGLQLRRFRQARLVVRRNCSGIDETGLDRSLCKSTATAARLLKNQFTHLISIPSARKAARSPVPV